MVVAHGALSFFFTHRDRRDDGEHRGRPVPEVGASMTATIQTLLLLLGGAGAGRGHRAAPQDRALDPAGHRRHRAGAGARACRAIELAPELVLLVLLPPLIYSAGVSMSWREFRFNLRPIALLAFGCVVFTTCAVAAAMHYLLGWPWGVAFVLGAIVAPPDVVAPLAIARRLGTAAPPPGRARRRRPRQRRHRADPLPLRGRRGRDRHVLAAAGRRHLRADRGRRDRLWHRRRLAQRCGCGTGRAIRASRSRCR